MALEITDSTFSEIINSDKPVLVDFWATWCGPCRMLGPIIEEIATDFEGKAVVGKVDVDNNQQISMEFGIRNIPTVLIFKNGEVVDKLVGVSPKRLLRRNFLLTYRKSITDNERFPDWESVFEIFVSIDYCCILQPQ